ncbi:hypothetical protein CALCODRAFT_182641 [Calocera cornea HHB12733]|uniref:Uncharacterized protein n=1 Tax=Calocera cornea HHB12733 TaxID=1353952 RepID=A0A165HSB4_9BASI|nr:hypothetical protein CALCODRAFT_182641 [Calocera cornea HHB12733]
MTRQHLYAVRVVSGCAFHLDVIPYCWRRGGSGPRPAQPPPAVAFRFDQRPVTISIYNQLGFGFARLSQSVLRYWARLTGSNILLRVSGGYSVPAYDGWRGRPRSPTAAPEPVPLIGGLTLEIGDSCRASEPLPRPQPCPGREPCEVSL